MIKQRFQLDDTPSETGVGGGRRPDGRFAPGNQLSQGNVIARKAARCRAKLFDAVSTTDFEAVVRRVVKEAKAGESWACKLLFAYLLGEPVAADVLERIENLEAVQQNRKQ
jgi:hypothetical protein